MTVHTNIMMRDDAVLLCNMVALLLLLLYFPMQYMHYCNVWCVHSKCFIVSSHELDLLELYAESFTRMQWRSLRKWSGLANLPFVPQGNKVWVKVPIRANVLPSPTNQFSRASKCGAPSKPCVVSGIQVMRSSKKDHPRSSTEGVVRKCTYVHYIQSYLGE